MILKRSSVLILAIFLGTTGLSTAKTYGATPVSPEPGYGQERGGWDAAPQELQEMQRRGFHDGIEGARRDFDNHRQPNVNNRDEYRRPNVPFDDRRAYREGFRRGYEVGVSHLTGGGQEQMRAPERDGREMAPRMGSEIMRRGFEDGRVGARRDMDNHRRPDPNNRDEYRNPNVPRELQDEYREAFRRGYREAMSQLRGDRR